MRKLSYDFEELQPIKGAALYAHGFALIDYEYHPDEDDVGFRGGFSYSIDQIFLLPNNSKDPAIELAESDPLYRQIEQRLLNDYESSIIGEIEERESE